jgi:hypothetical protein
MRQTRIVMLTLIGVALVSLGAAPAAAAPAVDADTWVSGFCTAIADWQTTSNEAHNRVQDVTSNGVDGAAQARVARAGIVRSLDAAARASSRTSKAVKALGAPEVANGAKITSAIATAIEHTSKAFSTAKNTASKAPTDPTKFKAAMKKIETKVDNDLDAAGKDISGIDALNRGTELDKAFEQASACDFLNGS